MSQHEKLEKLIVKAEELARDLKKATQEAKFAADEWPEGKPQTCGFCKKKVKTLVTGLCMRCNQYNKDHYAAQLSRCDCNSDD